MDPTLFDEPLGPTGQFPDGKRNADDQGELNVGITHDDKCVVIAFGTYVSWLAIPPDQARGLAAKLFEHAHAIDGRGPRIQFVKIGTEDDKRT